MTVGEGRDRARDLRRIDLFAGVPGAETDRLAASSGTRRYCPGVRVMGPGDTGAHVYIVLEGSVRLFHRAPDGREVTVAVLGQGRVVGVSALFGAPTPVGLRAEAASDALVCTADVADFRALAERHPAVLLRLTQLLVARLLDVEEQLDRLSAGGTRARLAGVLARLGRDHGRDGGGGERSIGVPSTHAALAHQIGASRESVTRLLGAFEEAGLIRRAGRRLVLRDAARLEAEGVGEGARTRVPAR